MAISSLAIAILSISLAPNDRDKGDDHLYPFFHEVPQLYELCSTPKPHRIGKFLDDDE